MFKKPFRVEVNADDTINVEHKINIDPNVYYRARALVRTSGETAIKVLVVGIAAKTASDVLTHIVKTRIK